jgi:ATP-dependent exoDNAse (exonuclease V) beta subunit
VLHKALAMIGSAADIEKTVNRLLTEGLIKESETGYYIDELNQIISHADAAQWYSGKYELKPEREIIVPGKSTIRPDRVLIKDGKAILIDYKTGTETETHTEQINMYADVLQKAGYKDVEKYIYYITERKVKKV